MKQIIIILISAFIWGCTSSVENQINFNKLSTVKEQIFQINNQKDTVLIGKQGTLIQIPNNILARGIKNTDVFEVALKEFYTKSDMLLAGLSTSADGKIIETNGMINLSIYLNGEKIDKIDKCIDIEFSQKKKSNDFVIFYGNLSNNKMDWSLDTITKNYHIFFNYVLIGNPCVPFDCCDYALDTLRLDSIPWSKSYTKVDSIYTFTESYDTLDYPSFWQAESVQPNPILNSAYKISKLDWINCDRFIEAENLTEIQVKSNAQSSPVYFLVFDEINSIMPNAANEKFNNIPIGYIVKLIGIEKWGGKFYFGMTDSFKVMDKGLVQIELVEMDKENIVRKLQILDK